MDGNQRQHPTLTSSAQHDASKSRTRRHVLDALDDAIAAAVADMRVEGNPDSRGLLKSASTTASAQVVGHAGVSRTYGTASGAMQRSDDAERAKSTSSVQEQSMRGGLPGLHDSAASSSKYAVSEHAGNGAPDQHARPSPLTPSQMSDAEHVDAAASQRTATGTAVHDSEVRAERDSSATVIGSAQAR
eukprot:TRINITY_DN23624_c0_g1_i1.p1 TRINITY_DN23624_c0_g1~~TRINITY_DN23624_c0_g1_i1.p1  ORF type:complete len:218 (-),score=29.51 TRINITY_DN23624_c0_g1_i1:296-859(-)